MSYGGSGLSTGLQIFYIILVLCVVGVFLYGGFKMYQKAGYGGWEYLIPIYRRYCLYSMAAGKGWWFLLELIPIVNLFIRAIMCMKLSSAFGKGGGYAVGLFFFEQIFIIMLGFGDARYNGPQM